MPNTLEWLEEIEKSAASLYTAAARHFRSDPPFAAFLKRLADEELWHVQLIRSLGSNRESEGGNDLWISIDDETRSNISELFKTGYDRLAAGEMSREAMLQTIAVAEFSEWNEIFLYMLHALQGSGREYQEAVAEIERHKEEIAEFLASEPGGGRFLDIVNQLPAVAGKRILIIEKHRPLARLLRSIVATIGEVELVESGPEGLARIENEHYDVVISDINMLAMNSLEFYERVVGMNPQMKDCFVFFAGSNLQEKLEAQNAGEVIGQPAMVGLLRRTVAGIAHRSRIFH